MDIMKSLESLPALVSRLEAALGEASPGPLQMKPANMPLQVSDDRWSEFRYAKTVII
jgi:hypothetical protein